jgi:lysophospholipase L1-like esterase
MRREWVRPVVSCLGMIALVGICKCNGVSLPPRSVVRDAVADGYPYLMILFLFSGFLLVGTVRIAPRRARGLLLRLILVWVGLGLGLGLCEIVAWGRLSWSHRVAALPGTLPSSSGSKRGDVTLVVMGESSAEGVPYRDWFSVGKIVVWQLRTLMPQRFFHVEVQARAGWTLEQMQQRFGQITNRPDVVVLYAGHNEFASRYGWSYSAPYYDDEPSFLGLRAVANRLRAASSVAQLLDEVRQRSDVAAPPRPERRSVVDVPSCTTAQYAERLADVRRRLESIAAYCQRQKVVFVLVIPPGNEADFEPNRSLLPSGTPRAERESFAREVLAARALEAADQASSIARYQALIERQPGFAETHYRLARLLERAGAVAESREEYALARDLDGHPMRLPSSFQDIYRDVARSYDAILVDGPAVLRASHPLAQLNDALFHDGFHPSFEGHVLLAEAILSGLRTRGALHWPMGVAVPRIDRDECARHFDVNASAWMSACEFASGFYKIASGLRFEPTERLHKQHVYAAAYRAVSEGAPAESLDLPGIGLPSLTRTTATAETGREAH